MCLTEQTIMTSNVRYLRERNRALPACVRSRTPRQRNADSVNHCTPKSARPIEQARLHNSNGLNSSMINKHAGLIKTRSFRRLHGVKAIHYYYCYYYINIYCKAHNASDQTESEAPIASSRSNTPRTKLPQVVTHFFPP